jgi:hypothetical protein
MEAVVEGVIEPLVHKALADAHHGVAAHLKRFGDVLIGPPRTRRVAINLQ